MDTTITFWEPEQKTFYYLDLKTLRSIIAWGYNLPYEQTEQVEYNLNNSEYWYSIQATCYIDEEDREDYRAELLEGKSPSAEDLLEELAARGKIPPGDYLLSVY